MDLVPVADLLAMKAPEGNPVAVYRLYDHEGVLLYAGNSGNLRARLQAHAHTQPWWAEVTSGAVSWCEDKDEAEWAEGAWIHLRSPKHNTRQTSADWALLRDTGTVFLHDKEPQPGTTRFLSNDALGVMGAYDAEDLMCDLFVAAQDDPRVAEGLAGLLAPTGLTYEEGQQLIAAAENTTS